jgi:CBS domain-containing protein
MTLLARDIMTKELFSVHPEMPLIEMDQALSARAISGAPVVENGVLIGIVTRTDIARKFSSNFASETGQASYYWHSDGTLAELIIGAHTDQSVINNLEGCTVQDIMTNRVISVAPDDSVVSVARLMTGHKIHRILVVDHGQPVGLITSLDLVGVIARQNEQHNQ